MARRDLSSVWIALADLLFAVLAVVIVSASAVRAKKDGVEMKAEYLVTISWNANVDADVDNWLVVPGRHPVFYGNRQSGCVTLDTDNKGFGDSVITLADGSKSTIRESKEIITIRCVDPGHYDHGVHLYAYRVGNVGQVSRTDLGLPVHVEVVALNPAVKTVFAKDIVLDYVEQTVNTVSFDIDRAGKITLTEPPLAPVTDAYYHPAGGQQ